MGLQLGIVGLPNAGKSTLFNALTRAGAAVAPYPFTTIESNVGIATLADPWLNKLAEVVRPERVIPATIEFVDIAGLVKGAHQGEGLGNQFLGHIRNVDANVLVARCFGDLDVPHPYDEIDPVTDLEVLDLELALADLSTVERRLSKIKEATKATPRDRRAGSSELAALESLRDVLQAGKLAIQWGRQRGQMDLVRGLGLLTGKPRLFVANVGEGDLPEGGAGGERVLARAAAEGGEAVVICAQLEMDLLDWSLEEAVLYLKELGMAATGLDRLVAAGFRLLDLITFFTITGGKEVRAWPVPRGTTAPVAAGEVHTDMERGFIRAEVISADELVAARSWAEARDTGQMRIEGRDYQIRDGDVVHFRFSV